MKKMGFLAIAVAILMFFCIGCENGSGSTKGSSSTIEIELGTYEETTYFYEIQVAEGSFSSSQFGNGTWTDIGSNKISLTFTSGPLDGNSTVATIITSTIFSMMSPDPNYSNVLLTFTKQ